MSCLVTTHQILQDKLHLLNSCKPFLNILKKFGINLTIFLFTFERNFPRNVDIEEMHFSVSLDEFPLRIPNCQRVVQVVPISLRDGSANQESLGRLSHFPQGPAGVAIWHSLCIF